MRSRLFNGLARDDSGAALAIALVFLLVVGLVITASLTKSGAILTTDLKVRDTAQAQYAADGAIERGLQVLRTQVQSGSTSACRDTSSGTSIDYGDTGGFALNGHKAHYSCKTIQGSVPEGDGSQFSNYAVVTTAGDDSLQTKNASGDKTPVPIDGPVYVSGTEKNADLSKTIEVSDGSFYAYDKGNHTACVANLAALTAVTIVTAQRGKVCTEQTPKQALPNTVLPKLPAGTVTNPPSADLSSTVGKKTVVSCRVFFPGKYTVKPALLADSGGGASIANYFVSGEYDFENIDVDPVTGKDMGPWQIDGNTVVIGGQPAPGDKSVDPQPSTTGCASLVADNKGNPLSDGDALTAVTNALSGLPVPLPMPTVGVWPHGTLFVMGGVSELQVLGAISLYTPPSTAAGSTAPVPQGPAVSFVAARSDKWFDATATNKDSDQGYNPWMAGSAKTVAALDTATAQPNMTFNARVLSPDADISVFASNPSTAVTRQGLVGRVVSLAASAGVKSGNFAFQVQDHSDQQQPIAERTVLITACVRTTDESVDCTGDASSNTITQQAVATIDNTGSYAIRVYSWRVLSPPHS